MNPDKPFEVFAVYRKRKPDDPYPHIYDMVACFCVTINPSLAATKAFKDDSAESLANALADELRGYGETCFVRSFDQVCCVNIEYAHFVWQKGNHPRWTKLKVLPYPNQKTESKEQTSLNYETDQSAR